jgi:uncharacterized membrane protein YphA (DoxX/SURF4 family)
MGIFRLLARVAIGLLFFGHGAQKKRVAATASPNQRMSSPSPQPSPRPDRS